MPGSTDTISQRLAAYCAAARWEQLPHDVIETSKRLALDTLAVAWAGTSAPGIAEVYASLNEDGGRAESTAWAFGGCLPARNAAFINSAAAAALDYDGMRATARGSVHADSVVLPAALALAERRRASGREFLTALIVGNDLVARLGAASALPHRGWYHTSIYGVFGAAAAAAKLLRLDADATAHALGIALSQAASTQLPNIERTLTKRLSSAFAAQAGVTAALLAHCGVTAPREVFEGKFGFYALYQPGEPERVFAGLGEEFPHLATAIKKYPSCACNHMAIEAAIQLQEAYRLAPADIDAVQVTISPYVQRLCGAAFEPGADPQVAAQFSVQYSVAVPLLRGRFGLADIQPAAVTQEDAVTLSRRVKVVVDPQWENSRAATVEIASRRHGTLSKHVSAIPGAQDTPLAANAIEAKIRDCFGSGVRPLSASRVTRLLDAWNTLDHRQDMAGFFAWLETA